MIYLCTPFSRAAALRLERHGSRRLQDRLRRVQQLPARAPHRLVRQAGHPEHRHERPRLGRAGRDHSQVGPRALRPPALHLDVPHPLQEGPAGGLAELGAAFPDAVRGSERPFPGQLHLLAAVALGASILEKHFTSRRSVARSRRAHFHDPAELRASRAGARAITRPGRKKDILRRATHHRLRLRMCRCHRDIVAGEPSTRQRMGQTARHRRDQGAALRVPGAAGSCGATVPNDSQSAGRIWNSRRADAGATTGARSQCSPATAPSTGCSTPILRAVRPHPAWNTSSSPAALTSYDEFGRTVAEIAADGFHVHAQVGIQSSTRGRPLGHPSGHLHDVFRRDSISRAVSARFLIDLWRPVRELRRAGCRQPDGRAIGPRGGRRLYRGRSAGRFGAPRDDETGAPAFHHQCRGRRDGAAPRRRALAGEHRRLALPRPRGQRRVRGTR